MSLNPRLMVILSVWFLFIVVFIRALVRGKVVSKPAQRLWLMFFLCCLAFSFWGESAELALDRYFGYRPVALLIKYVCLVRIGTIHGDGGNGTATFIPVSSEE